MHVWYEGKPRFQRKRRTRSNGVHKRPKCSRICQLFMSEVLAKTVNYNVSPLIVREDVRIFIVQPKRRPRWTSQGSKRCKFATIHIFIIFLQQLGNMMIWISIASAMNRMSKYNNHQFATLLPAHFGEPLMFLPTGVSPYTWWQTLTCSQNSSSQSPCCAKDK